MKFYNFVMGLFRIFCNLFFRYEVSGTENIPDTGNIVIAANHKANIDPVFVAAAIRNRKVAAVAKKELFDIKPLGYVLKKLNVIPIDRDNPGISTIKSILKLIKEGYAVGLFPEGTRVRGYKFGEGKAGVAMFATKGKASVIPVSVISTYKIFSRVKVYFGEPIPMDQYFKSKLTNDDYERISNDIMKVIVKNYCDHSDGIIDPGKVEYDFE